MNLRFLLKTQLRWDVIEFASYIKSTHVLPQDTMDKDFFIAVLSRMTKPSGLPVSEKTVQMYARALQALNKRGDLVDIQDPKKMLDRVSARRGNSQTLLTSLRPSQMLIGNMTVEERKAFGLEDIDVTRVLEEYSALLRDLTARRKAENLRRLSEPQTRCVSYR